MNNLPIGHGLTVPTSDKVEGILERFQAFAEKPGNEPIAEALKYRPIPNGTNQGINRASITDLVAAMYLDMLHNFSKWNHGGANDEYVQAQLQRMIPQWNEAPSSMYGRILSEVIKPVDEEVHDWVVWFNPADADWSIWYVRRLGYDVIIVRGEDYRILDWERRMALAKDFVEAEENGETPPSDAWVPDKEARRFVELLKQQQHEPSPLGKTAIDDLDNERIRRRRQLVRTSTARPFRRPGGL